MARLDVVAVVDMNLVSEVGKAWEKGHVSKITQDVRKSVHVTSTDLRVELSFAEQWKNNNNNNNKKTSPRQTSQDKDKELDQGELTISISLIKYLSRPLVESQRGSCFSTNYDRILIRIVWQRVYEQHIVQTRYCFSANQNRVMLMHCMVFNTTITKRLCHAWRGVKNQESIVDRALHIKNQSFSCKTCSHSGVSSIDPRFDGSKGW